MWTPTVCEPGGWWQGTGWSNPTVAAIRGDDCGAETWLRHTPGELCSHRAPAQAAQRSTAGASPAASPGRAHHRHRALPQPLAPARLAALLAARLAAGVTPEVSGDACLVAPPRRLGIGGQVSGAPSAWRVRAQGAVRVARGGARGRAGGAQAGRVWRVWRGSAVGGGEGVLGLHNVAA